MTSLRLYDVGVDDFLPDGYPRAWRFGDQPIKDLVRALAGHRCVRCHHPYRGGGEWSPCDHDCAHRGPVRMEYWVDGEHVVIPDHQLATEAGVVVGYGLAAGLGATCVIDRAREMTEESIRLLWSRNPQEHAFGLYQPGRWAWVLRDIVQLGRPVPWTGSQGTFDVPDDLEAHAAQGVLLG